SGSRTAAVTIGANNGRSGGGGGRGAARRRRRGRFGVALLRRRVGGALRVGRAARRRRVGRHLLLAVLAVLTAVLAGSTRAAVGAVETAALEHNSDGREHLAQPAG